MPVRLRDLQELLPQPRVTIEGGFRQALGIDLPVFAINLAHRADRWSALSRRLAAIGLDRVARVDAVEGAKLDVSTIALFLGDYAGRIDQPPRSHLALTRPALGCFLSHLALWRWVVESGLERVLILEDDAAPVAGFDGARLRSLLGALEPAHGLVLLGSIVMNGMAERVGDLARLYYFNGTFAYLVTPQTCRTLLTAMLPPRCHIDHQISNLLVERREVLHAFHASPAFFEPDWSLRSDCFVPLIEESEADRELGMLLNLSRQILLAEGRPLLPAQ